MTTASPVIDRRSARRHRFCMRHRRGPALHGAAKLSPPKAPAFHHFPTPAAPNLNRVSPKRGTPSAIGDTLQPAETLTSHMPLNTARLDLHHYRIWFANDRKSFLQHKSNAVTYLCTFSIAAKCVPQQASCGAAKCTPQGGCAREQRASGQAPPRPFFS